jgi:hypothetical protein
VADSGAQFGLQNRRGFPYWVTARLGGAGKSEELFPPGRIAFREHMLPESDNRGWPGQEDSKQLQVVVLKHQVSGTISVSQFLSALVALRWSVAFQLTDHRPDKFLADTTLSQ